MRKEAYFTLIVVLLIWIQFGCLPPTNISDRTTDENRTQVNSDAPAPTFIMGSYNIQTFGVNKIGQNDVMRTLVDIVRRFDLLAIQELRSIPQHIVPDFLDMLNADGSNYKAEVSARLGHTTYKEQFIYIYDANKFEVTRPSHVVPDPNRIMHRSLYVTSFRCTEAPAQEAFTFTLLNVHVDPQEIKTEIPALKGFVQNVVREIRDEDDFIVLGDFNVPDYWLAENPMLANQVVAIPDELLTTTRQTKSIDNIVFDEQATREYYSNSGVLDVQTDYGLSLEDAVSVSDHLPVWAEFSIYEKMPSDLATPNSNAPLRR